MGFDPASLPPHVLRLMSEKDRKKLGKGAQLPEETAVKAEHKSEKELQRDIVNLLRLRGIEVNVSRMDKAKTDKVGWPDLTFAVHGATPGWARREFSCLWEVKLPGKDLDAKQREVRDNLVRTPNAWRYRVIHSVKEALTELEEMGIG